MVKIDLVNATGEIRAARSLALFAQDELDDVRRVKIDGRRRSGRSRRGRRRPGREGDGRRPWSRRGGWGCGCRRPLRSLDAGLAGLQLVDGLVERLNRGFARREIC
ncbi:MAG TPA: hypothetical protein VLH81_09590, partial [Desulfobacterales bacterium]|nr:hypothetical protein [Desulfobacterales bacterium]